MFTKSMSRNNFYIKIQYKSKSLKFVFKAFFSDQAFWDFLDAWRTFFAVCIKKIGLQKL